MSSFTSFASLPNTPSFPKRIPPSKGKRRFWVVRGSMQDGNFASSFDNSCSTDDCGAIPAIEEPRRRKLLFSSAFGLFSGAFSHALGNGFAIASEFADMPALRGKDYGKTRMRYPDYIETPSGLQYKDLRVGDGPSPKMGETVVVDWDGYTIGYYGRIFEARNKTKGGSFEGDDKDFFKFKFGTNQVIPAFEEAVAGMAPGGIRSNAGS